MRRLIWTLPGLATLGLSMVAIAARAATAPATGPTAGYGATPTPNSADTTYVFGWGDTPSSKANPRGGTSQGAPVTLAPGQPLPLPGVAAGKNDYERDRAAILGLAGDFRVSFHEIELVGLGADYVPPRPYNSWATEHIQVIADTGRLISLQHTLVMYFQGADGQITGPALTKHWRQDWTYEKTDLHMWRGNDVWERRRVSPAETSATWTHSVFNLDDSPRYETVGHWEHRGNVSSWTSERAWRPLPRREYTVRKDYDVLEGTHRVTITPTGWAEERDMWKRATDGGKAVEPPRYLAEEIGIDRYERITAPSLAAAESTWKKTSAYWAIVRQVWAENIAQHDRFTIRDEVDGKNLYDLHTAYLKKILAGEAFDAADAERYIRAAIAKFVAPDASDSIR